MLLNYILQYFFVLVNEKVTTAIAFTKRCMSPKCYDHIVLFVNRLLSFHFCIDNKIDNKTVQMKTAIYYYESS